MRCLVVALMLTGCGWPEPPDYVLPNGLAVSVHTTSAKWAHADDFAATLEALTSEAVQWWGGDADALCGWELVFLDDRPCGGASGCEVEFRDAIEVYVGEVYAGCYPHAATVIWHEIGHVVIGDGAHVSPQWGRVPTPPGICVTPPPRIHPSQFVNGE